MNTRAKTILFIVSLLFAFMGCKYGGGYNKNSNNYFGLYYLLYFSGNDMVANISQSALESVNDGMSDINESGQTGVSYRIQYPKFWWEDCGFQERVCMAMNSLTDLFSAHAATLSCPTSGSITVTDPTNTWSNSAASSFFVERNFNSCGGPFGFATVTGDTLLSWSNMESGQTGADKLHNGSILQQAPVNKRFTRNATGSYITVAGNGSQITDGTLTGNVAHTLTWSSVSGSSRTYTDDINLTRTGHSSDGTVIFTHTVTTPTVLTINADLNAQTRTIVSGTVRVVFTLAGIAMDTAFSNLVIPMGNCIPSSGSASITLSGAKSGTCSRPVAEA